MHRRKQLMLFNDSFPNLFSPLWYVLHYLILISNFLFRSFDWSFGFYSFLVSRDPKQCDNKHNFCATCIFAWSMTYGANCDKCPVCRHKQQDYLSNRKANTEIMQQWVKCPETGCALRCPLRDFMQHSHGIKQYGVTPELDRLRRTRPEPVTPLPSSSVVMFPNLRGTHHPMAQVLLAQ